MCVNTCLHIHRERDNKHENRFHLLVIKEIHIKESKHHFAYQVDKILSRKQPNIIKMHSHTLLAAVQGDRIILEINLVILMKGLKIYKGFDSAITHLGIVFKGLP